MRLDSLATGETFMCPLSQRTGIVLGEGVEEWNPEDVPVGFEGGTATPVRGEFEVLSLALGPMGCGRCGLTFNTPDAGVPVGGGVFVHTTCPGGRG
jgi:hypothetical protein